MFCLAGMGVDWRGLALRGRHSMIFNFTNAHQHYTTHRFNPCLLSPPGTAFAPSPFRANGSKGAQTGSMALSK